MTTSKRTSTHTPASTPDDADMDAAAARFGWTELHPGQREAITAVVAGRDTLAVMPTGYGKSAIYQVAALLVAGPTVVVSPLIALQADQVAGLAAHTGPDGPRAVAINSSRSSRQNDAAWQALEDGSATFVFLAPEQLAKDEIVERLLAAHAALFVVDEAHCVSSWGHDFRPDYLALGEVIERLGHPPVLAMTATGSGPVRDEIVERLGMRDALVVARGFDRPNLGLEVVRHEDGDAKVAAVVAQVAALPGPGLVYVATRRETAEITEALTAENGSLRVRGYHAGFRASERQEVHEAFLAGELDVVVATNAFGMGIDKPDVRFVVHADVPDSVDSYYQEIGRAGRDGEPATATLHYRSEDLGLRSFFASGLPGRGELRRVAAAIPTDSRLRRSAVAAAAGISTRSTGRLVGALIDGGAVTDAREGLQRTAGTSPEQAAAKAHDRAADHERVEASRVAMMQQYAETTGCRRQFLLGYFGDELAEPCGNCDTCASGSAEQAEHRMDGASDGEFPPSTEVEHDQWGHGTVMSTEDDRVTVFFESEGYRVLSLVDVHERHLLRTA